MSEKFINSNPMDSIDSIKYELKKRGYLNKMDVELLRENLKTLKQKAMIEFMLSTGCRVADVCNVKIKDIDFYTNKVIVFGKGRKYRTVYLNSKAVLAIKNYLNSRHDNCEYLFVSDKGSHFLSTNAIEKMITKIDNQLEGKLSVHLTPHILRHTFATLSVKAGMSIETVSKILGHTNINVTMIYAEIDDIDIKTAYDKYVS